MSTHNEEVTKNINETREGGADIEAKTPGQMFHPSTEPEKVPRTDRKAVSWSEETGDHGRPVVEGLKPDLPKE